MMKAWILITLYNISYLNMEAHCKQFPYCSNKLSIVPNWLWVPTHNN